MKVNTKTKGECAEYSDFHGIKIDPAKSVYPQNDYFGAVPEVAFPYRSPYDCLTPIKNIIPKEFKK